MFEKSQNEKVFGLRDAIVAKMQKETMIKIAESEDGISDICLLSSGEWIVRRLTIGHFLSRNLPLENLVYEYANVMDAQFKSLFTALIEKGKSVQDYSDELLQKFIASLEKTLQGLE